MPDAGLAAMARQSMSLPMDRHVAEPVLSPAERLLSMNPRHCEPIGRGSP